MTDQRQREALMALMAQDIEVAKNLMASGDASTQAAGRRTYVRLVLDTLESLIHVQKMWVLEGGTCFFGQTRDLFTESETLLLRDERPVIRKKGEADVAPAILDLEKNVQFLLRQMAKTEKLSYDKLWQCVDAGKLRVAKNVRNRVTHAKTPSDLDISKGDVETIEGAWNSVYAALMMASSAAPNEF